MVEPYNEFIFYGIIAASLILLRFPYINKYFRVFNTMIHEDGHALVALLTGGRVIKINLFNDVSGECVTQSKGWLRRFLIAIAGYMTSPLVALLFFWLIKQGKYMEVLWIFCGLTVLNLLLFVRNGYGITWLLIFAILNGTAIYLNTYLQMSLPVYILAVFFSATLLLDSVISCFHLIIIAYKTPDKAGDASNLHEIALLPSLLWAIAFLGFAGFVAYKTILLFIS